MRTWIIGSSSDYSKAIAGRCVGVTNFGRDTIDYGQSFEAFIKKQKYLPNRIFINIGVEEKLSVDINSPDGEWIQMLQQFSKTWLWKIRLYSYFYNERIPCTICDVTSSITMWPSNHREHMAYATLRAMGQQAAMAHNTDTLKIIQVSPNGISPERIGEYADKTVAWMREPELAVNCIVDLDNNNLIGLREIETE
jgi:hypothetical protein